MSQKKLSLVAKLLQAERQRREANPNAPSDFAPAVLSEIEANLGRKLTQRERMTASLDGRHVFDVMDRIRRSGFTPTVPTPEVDLIDAEIQRVKQQIFDERLAKASPAERQLALLQRAKADEIARQMEAEQIEKERKQREPMLKRAQALLEEMSDNPAFDFDAVDAVGRLIVALEHPGSSIDEIGELYQRAEGYKRDYVSKVRQELNSRIGELSSELVAFESEVGFVREVEGSGSRSDWLDDPRYIQLREYQNTDAYKALDQKGKNAIWNQIDAIKANYADPV